nr:semaphorin-4G [Pelodiscus sinensis]|eukprot:XP_025039299.1 semaphorin-4G [Pelodiscus sinensis]
MRRPMAWYPWVLFVAATVGSPSRRSAVDLDATPRTTVAYHELSGARRFSDHALNYTTLLLEDERGILYVGARGAIFALNSSNIADGSQRKVSDPPPVFLGTAVPRLLSPVQTTQGSSGWVQAGQVAFLAPGLSDGDGGRAGLRNCLTLTCPSCPGPDGGLYTATRYEFRSLPDIRRNLHQRPLKTEESPVHWLNDAEFVASVLVRESVHSPVGDDDKIYYFFMERAGEERTSFDKSQVARVASVARVCKVRRRCRIWGLFRGGRVDEMTPFWPETALQRPCCYPRHGS